MSFGTLSLTIAIGLAMPALSGCTQPLKSQNLRLITENSGLRDQLAEAQAALDASDRERIGLSNEAARLRMANQDLHDQVDRMTEQSEQPPDAGGFGGIPGVTQDVRSGEVAAIVEGDVLFASGQATLRTGAKSTLDQIAGVLNSTYAGLTVRIEGHTDTDPIRKSQWKTNDRLSCERAMAVKDYLQSKGVAADGMYVAGFGSTRGKATKEQSRRVEIVVILK